MAIANLNKNFQCNNPLYASDLNDIVAALNSIINHVNSNQSGWDNSHVDVPTISYDPSTGVLTIDGTPYQIENPNDQNLGVAVYEGCPGTIQNPQVGAIYKCTSTGHIYIYTGKNSDSVTINGTTRIGWFDLGEFSGSGSSYLHIAYAQSITFNNANPPVITGYEGFTTSVNTGTFYKWYGIYTDDNEEDPTISNNNSSAQNLEIVRKYKWNYLKGPDTNNKEYIYMYSDDKTHSPSAASTTGYAKINGTWSSEQTSNNDEFLPNLNNTNSYFRRNYWYDDPIENVSATWPVLWWSSRSRNSDGTWGAFRTPTILDEYTLVNSGQTPSGSQGGPRWAFGRFSDSTAASSAVNTINANITEGSTFTIPSGWSESDNLASGSGDLYMIYAYVNGSGEIIKNQRTVSGQTQDFYWYGPFRIGSNNSTSGIGADDDNYNYIYCRTTSDVVSTSNGNTQLTNDDWSRIIYNIELQENNFVSNNEHVYDSSSTINNYNNLWTDHPQGVSSIYPYEWKMAFTKVQGETVNIGGGTTAQKYKLEWGPFLDSHFGHDGRDGDGFEYIFKVGNFETNTIISYTNAKYRNPDYPQSGSEFITGVNANANDLLNDTNYQHDDFIPNGWTDENGTIDQNNPVEYMSKRKREDSNGERKWGPFSSPVIWRTFASSGLLATIDNDSIFIDDNAGKDTVEYASQTIPALWDGANNLTEVNNYTVTISYRGDPDLKSLLIPGKATINNNNVEVDQNSNNRGWDKSFSASANSKQLFALTTTSQNPNFVNGQTGQIIYTVTANGITQSIVQPISVVDFGTDAQAFTLMITPNCATVKRTNSSSNYTFYDGTKNCTLTVEVAKSTGSGVSPVTVQGILPSSNPTDEKLYIKVKNSSGSYLSTTSSANNPYYSYSSPYITLNNITPLSTDYNYLEVELYYIYSGNAIKVDNEIINFVPKGDDGTIDGDLSSIETYNIVTENDNAYIDDQTVNANVLKTATTYILNVLKGTSDITSACSFEVVDINLPSGLGLYPITNISYGTIGNQLSTGNTSSYNAFCIQPTGSPSITTIPISDQYYYTLKLKHSGITTQNITKKFKLVVLNISIDGSIYMLNIKRDILKYDSSETLINTSYPQFFVGGISVNNGEMVQSDQTYTPCENLPSNANDSTLYLVLGDLYTYCYPKNASTSVTLSGQIPYQTNGYSVKLYLGSTQIGEENIDCIKDGGGAVSGYSSIIKRLYTLSSTIPNKPSESSYCNLRNGKLYKTNTSGTLSNELSSSDTYTQINPTNSSSTNYVLSRLYGTSEDVGWTASFNAIKDLKSNYSSKYENYKFYVIAATASGAADTIDEIVYTEWSDPIECDETGADKLNVKTIFLYYRGDSAPSKPKDAYYYKFSTEQLLSNRFTVPTNGYKDENSNYWLRSISNPDITKNLYVTFATASSFYDLDEITTSEWSTPEMYSAGIVTPQSAASVGKFYYYAGEYKTGDSLPNNTFITTKYQAPYIKYNEKFYVLYVLDSELTDGEYTASGWPGSSETHWVEMEGGINKFYIAEAYFGNQAYFGSAIINQDFLLSKYGFYVDSWHEKEISYTNLQNENKYTDFDASDPSGKEIKIYPQSQIEGEVGYSNSNSYSTTSFQLNQGLYTLRTFYSDSGINSITVTLYKFNGNSQVSILTKTISSNTSDQYTFFEISNSDSGDYYINVSGYNDTTINGLYIGISDRKWVPYYFINLKTGFSGLNNLSEHSKISSNSLTYSSLINKKYISYTYDGTKSIYLITENDASITLPYHKKYIGKLLDIYFYGTGALTLKNPNTILKGFSGNNWVTYTAIQTDITAQSGYAIHLRLLANEDGWNILQNEKFLL